MRVCHRRHLGTHLVHDLGLIIIHLDDRWVVRDTIVYVIDVIYIGLKYGNVGHHEETGS